LVDGRFSSPPANRPKRTPAEGPEKVQAIGVAGAFEPGSEWVNPYDLLMLPAVASDAAVIFTIIMLYCGRGLV
jgi:hypothetical protein